PRDHRHGLPPGGRLESVVDDQPGGPASENVAHLLGEEDPGPGRHRGRREGARRRRAGRLPPPRLHFVRRRRRRAEEEEKGQQVSHFFRKGTLRTTSFVLAGFHSPSPRSSMPLPPMLHSFSSSDVRLDWSLSPKGSSSSRSSP